MKPSANPQICRLLGSLILGWLALAGPCLAMTGEILSVQKIWDLGEHNAFTDLVRFQNRWYCCFREAKGHVGGDGRIRILVSEEGERWESAALLSERGIDLRDPKLSIAPDGRLLCVMGGSVYAEKTILGRRSRVSFSADGTTWTPTERVLEEGQWLWRVTWHKGVGYGLAYGKSDAGDRWGGLYSTRDGLHYEPICDWDVPGISEVTLGFLPDDSMLSLVRREFDTKVGWIGRSQSPYTDWAWHETEYRLGGPDFETLPDGRMVAGSRDYTGETRMMLAEFGPEKFEPFLNLPATGDSSYPGMVWHEGLLWVVYYASHEGKSCIYLAKVKID